MKSANIYLFRKLSNNNYTIVHANTLKEAQDKFLENCVLFSEYSKGLLLPNLEHRATGNYTNGETTLYYSVRDYIHALCDDMKVATRVTDIIFGEYPIEKMKLTEQEQMIILKTTFPWTAYSITNLNEIQEVL